MRLTRRHACVLSCLFFVVSGVQLLTLASELPTVRVPIPEIITGDQPLPSVETLPALATLPDVLIASDGMVVDTIEKWRQRRIDLGRTLTYYAVGKMPAKPDAVTGRVLKEETLLDGAVQYRLVHVSFGPEQSLGFDIALFIPQKAAGPMPTIVWPSFDLTPGAVPLATMPRRPEQGKGLDSLTLPLGIPAPSGDVKPQEVQTPEKFAATHRTTLERGYVLVTYHYQDCGEDTIARSTDGSWAFRTTRFGPAYPQCDWGLLGAWAWGVSRCIDYLETQPFADKAAFIATGHSRIGKAILVAGALDERIALSAPVGSAGGGVGTYRDTGFGHGGGEGLADILRKYPNWFSPHLYQFAGAPEKLPFDQHAFVAMTAPRGFIALEGTSDRICSPKAVRASLTAAAPVYKLYAAEYKLGLHYGDHGHAFAPVDWTALLDFADKLLRKQTSAPEHTFRAAPAVQVFNVKSYGAIGDGRVRDTVAFQQALDRCFAAGGGEVVVPAGEYSIGAIELRSHTTLRLEAGARLVGSDVITDYPLAQIRWEGRWEQGHRALIWATDADNIAIIGGGHIAGAEKLGVLRNPRAPALIEPIHCRGVKLEGFSTSYASMWSVHPTRCHDVSVQHLTIRSTGGNGDGIDIDSCRDVRIGFCDIETGDDPIAIKSGRGMEGFLGEPSENITISDCRLGDLNYACIGIGSEMSGSVRNVLIERCVFTRSKTNSIYIKGRPGRGGVIENIHARDLTVLSAEGAFLRINLLKSGKDDPNPVLGEEGIPLGKNFSFENVQLANCGGVVDAVLIPPSKPVEGLKLSNIRGEARQGLVLSHITGLSLEAIEVTGYEGPLLKLESVTGAYSPAPDVSKKH